MIIRWESRLSRHSHVIFSLLIEGIWSAEESFISGSENHKIASETIFVVWSVRPKTIEHRTGNEIFRERIFHLRSPLNLKYRIAFPMPDPRWEHLCPVAQIHSSKFSTSRVRKGEYLREARSRVSLSDFWRSFLLNFRCNKVYFLNHSLTSLLSSVPNWTPPWISHWLTILGMNHW
jgi:hypothetical protein